MPLNGKINDDLWLHRANGDHPFQDRESHIFRAPASGARDTRLGQPLHPYLQVARTAPPCQQCFSLLALLLPARTASPCSHVLPDGATPCFAAAAASSSVGAASASAERQPLPRCSRHGFRGAATSSTQTLRHSTLASNKPHPAEKRTPVWLAIWRIWAGFANSQLRCAAFRSTY